MFKQNINNDFSIDEILFDYSDLIDEVMIDGGFTSEEEVARLIKVILLHVNSHRYDIIKFLISKTVELQRKNNTIRKKNIKGLIGDDSDDVIEMLYEKYYDKVSNEEELMDIYDEEFSYGNNNDYYNDLDHMNSKGLRKTIR